jgi:hypothetical protein
MQHSAHFWINSLKLKRHPEGGYFRETYRAAESIPATALPNRFQGSRQFSTAIYYLLQSEDFSALHRLTSDEIWHYYGGSPLDIHIIDPSGCYSKPRLGNDPTKDQSFQVVVEAGCWFGATVAIPGSYTLAGCSVAPGFDFADFELAHSRPLITRYPEHKNLIERLTRR